MGKSASADADRAGGLRPEPLAASQPEALIPCAKRIACEVMAEFLGVDPTDVHPESRGAQLIREGIRRYVVEASNTPEIISHAPDGTPLYFVEVRQ